MNYKKLLTLTLPCLQSVPNVGLLEVENTGATKTRDVNDVVRASVDFGINYFDIAEAHNESALMTGNGDGKLREKSWCSRTLE